MANVTTYSFSDLLGSISHPGVGQYVFTGQGTGEITVAMASDRTSHDLAADGSVMISKMPGGNGTMTVQIQQTSPVHDWLLNWYNYITHADASEWGAATMLLRSVTMNRSHDALGVSPQKLGDTPYQAQGGKVTWTLMCANIQNMAV